MRDSTVPVARPEQERSRPRPGPRDARVTLACKRCGARLVPILAPWGRDRENGTRAFRCPRLTACGYGGIVERGDPARRFHGRLRAE